MAELSHIDLDGETLEIADEKARKHIENNNNPHEVTAEDVGLGNVPNVSTNDQTPTFTEATALETLSSGEKTTSLFSKIAKAITTLISHLNATNPHGITKSTIGLGNVDNTADSSKPVSTQQQDAIDAAYQNAVAYADKVKSEIMGGVPASTLDTITELSERLQDDSDALSVLLNEVGRKANQTEVDSHTGNSTIHITATERTNWNNSYNNNHTHSNKSVLDGITSTLITAWNSAVTHISDAIKHITSEERTLWNETSATIGNTDISNVGDGTVTGAVKNTRGGLNGISRMFLDQLLDSLPIYDFGGDYVQGQTIYCSIDLDIPHILRILGELDGKVYNKYYYILIDNRNGGIAELLYDDTPVGVDFKHDVVVDWDEEKLSVTFLSGMDDVQYAVLYTIDFSATVFHTSNDRYCYVERNGFGTLSMSGVTPKTLATWYSTVKYKLGDFYATIFVLIDINDADNCYPGVVYINSSHIEVDYISGLPGGFNAVEMTDTDAAIYGSVTFPLF